MPKLYRPFENSSSTSLKDKLGGNVNPTLILKKLGVVPEATKTQSDGPGWYSYTVISPQGVRHKGKMQAPSASAVSEALQIDGWIPLDITQQATGGLNTDLGALVGSNQVRLQLKDLAAFARRLAEMLKAGVPLTRALISLGESGDTKFQNLCNALADKVASGVPLSEAMADYPTAFDDIFRSYVAAGESTGTLPLTISRLSKSLERRNAMAQKIKGVTAYPKFIGGIIGIIVIGIIWKLIPQFVSIYDNFDAELPAPTQILINFTGSLSPITFSLTAPMPWFTEVGLTFFGIIGRLVAIVVLFLFFEFLRIKRGKDQKPLKLVGRVILILMLTVFAADYKVNILSFSIWMVLGLIILGLIIYNEANKENVRFIRRKELLKYKIPIFGELIRLTTLYRWASTLAGALDSGVPMTQALELAANTTGSTYYKYIAKELQAAVRSGKPLSEGLAAHPSLYPSSIRSMILTGEQTGELAVMLESAASSIDVETDAIVAGLAAKIEVGLLVVMGVVVGGLIIVMYLPILNLAATGFSQGS